MVAAALLSASASLLAGCATTPLVGPAAVIRYRQIGACNATGGINAGAQNAFVLFQIDSIRNESSIPFNFDPTKLFVTGSPRAYVSTTSPLLGALNAGPASIKTIPGGQQSDFPPAAFGVVTVATVANDGAKEANQDRFFLNYDASPSDPPVLGEKLDLARTVWPDTPDCADIRPNLGQSAYMDQIGKISTFKIDPATGALTDLGKPVPDTLVPGDTNPGNFAVDPRGHFLYAMDSNLQTVLVYKVQPDGSLAPPTPSAATGFNPTGIVIDPAGRFLYVETNAGIDAFLVDAATGNLSKTGHINEPSVVSFAVDGSGRFLHVLASPATGAYLAAFAIDQSSGALSPVKNLVPLPIGDGDPAWWDQMTISPLSGCLYVLDGHSNTLRVFQFDPAKPSLTELPVATPVFAAEWATLTFDPSGEYIYVVNLIYGLTAFSVSATGALKPVAPPMSLVPSSFVAEPTGRFFYMTNQNGFLIQTTGYKLNSSNGALTLLPGAPLTVQGLKTLTIPGTY